MGVKERRREKPKTKEEPKTSERERKSTETVAVLEDTELEEVTHSPEVVIETKATTATTTSVKPQQQVVDQIEEQAEVRPTEEYVSPTWGAIDETEWMYSVPSRQEDLSLWANEWSDYLLEWSENKRIHIVSLATFIAEPPFKDLRDKVESFKRIGETLVEKEVAEWMDKKKRQLRIYWKPLEDWADLIYQWAIKTGKLRLDVKSIVIQEATEDFASLPEKDIHIVLSMLVKRGLAEWVDQEKGAILISTD
ncbi:MAG: hypothetical protein ACFFCP_11035 [Promethearchaeota archaeon]